ncbi:uncharacterized protein MICPUCDRAFT_40250 [Micromonas pusilla CCMP1545]|uniref:Predicted protein n=1 Tax=Micromonas pusilla (strain CCMP1545) TaxID=564608 RepID=C1MUN7_MICPC|nr:uncharacterized protein MICPUCDRAFT_40250 [Micromonas pusilla CCMP1545]EEH56661.1 predicted protein [Micromonas pusilla CCMP1545]|eukprot:XP_003059529.1 predicted protein [Micromonas pusilla CCMP1545]
MCRFPYASRKASVSSSSYSTAPLRPILCARTSNVPSLTLMSTHTSRPFAFILANLECFNFRYETSMARDTASRCTLGSASKPSLSVASCLSAVTIALRFASRQGALGAAAYASEYSHSSAPADRPSSHPLPPPSSNAPSDFPMSRAAALCAAPPSCDSYASNLVLVSVKDAPPPNAASAAASSIHPFPPPPLGAMVSNPALLSAESTASMSPRVTPPETTRPRRHSFARPTTSSAGSTSASSSEVPNSCSRRRSTHSGFFPPSFNPAPRSIGLICAIVIFISSARRFATGRST